MAREKRRILGQLAAYQIAMIASMFGGGEVSPDEINPYREKPVMSKALKALAERDNREAFHAAQQRQAKHGAKRQNVKHYPIIVKS